MSRKGEHKRKKKLSTPKQQEILQQLPQFVKGCYSDHPDTQFECIQKIRKILCIEECDARIQAVIDSGVVPRIIQFLQCDKFDELQCEAVWCLTNIASGTSEHTAVVIKHGAVPILVKLLQSQSDELKEHVIWALGNIAGDGPEYRDLVLSYGALNNLLPLFNTTQQLTLLRSACWILSQFCRSKPSADWKYIELLIKALTIIIESDDVEVLQDACWGMSYLSDIRCRNKVEQLLAIINSFGWLAIDRLIDLLHHVSSQVRRPALRTIGNFVFAGNDQHAQKMIDLGVLKKLLYLIQNDGAPIKGEACWTVSNIVAHSKHQIEAVIAGNLFQALMHILRNEEKNGMISKEAIWAISNATSGGTDMQIAFLVNQGALHSLCQFLRRKMHSNILLVTLEGIKNILAAGARMSILNKGRNQFAQYVEESGVVDFLKQLQLKQSTPYQKYDKEIYDKVNNIIRNYFDREQSNQEDNNIMKPNSSISDEIYRFSMYLRKHHYNYVDALYYLRKSYHCKQLFYESNTNAIIDKTLYRKYKRKLKRKICKKLCIEYIGKIGDALMYTQHIECGNTNCSKSHCNYNIENFKKCKGCKSIYYCGRYCQKQHWNNHHRLYCF